MGLTMTMNRVIHAAVRRDLARLETALADFPDGDDGDRATQLRRAYRYLRAELTRHHEGEDTWIWPMLESFEVDATLLAAMESEHHAMGEALAWVSDALDQLVATPTPEAAVAARTSVADAREVVDQHLAHEENDLEPQLLPLTETPEWHAVEKNLRKAPLTVAGNFFAWLEDGMDPESRSFLRATVPQPVTFVLGRVFGRRYHREVAPVWRS
ncbi:MAG: hemerythrin domain-containing protein [Nocardioides sp.]|nr:hemerythrin domain-containing protein [Nocardioides sp.]